MMGPSRCYWLSYRLWTNTSKNMYDVLHRLCVASLMGLDSFITSWIDGFWQGPYISGENISAVDLSLAPKLFHLKVALGHFKGWSIPENLTHLLAYLEVRIRINSSQLLYFRINIFMVNTILVIDVMNFSEFCPKFRHSCLEILDSGYTTKSVSS